MLNKPQYMYQRHVVSLLVLMVLCGSVISDAAQSLHSQWLSLSIAFVMFLPVVFLFSSICAAFPGKNLFDIIGICFSKGVAKFIIILFTVYFFLIGSLVLRNFVEYAVVISLPNTPRLPLIFAFAAVCVLIARSGPVVMGKWAFAMLIFIIANLLFTLLVSVKTMKFDNLLPFAPESVGDVFKDGWALGHILIGEIMIIMASMGSASPGLKTKRVFFKGALIGIILLIIIFFRNASILGEELMRAFKFSSHAAARIIRLGSDLERIESIISLNIVFLGLTKVSMSMYACSKGLSALFKTKKHKLFFPAIFIITAALTSLITADLMAMFEFVPTYPFLAVPFQIILPLIVLIAIIVHKLRKKEYNKNEH